MDSKYTEVSTDLSVMSRVFEHLEQAIVVASLERKILLINRAARELFGYSLEDLKQKSTQILYSDDEEYLRLGQSRYNQSAVSNEPSVIVKYKTKFGEEFIGKTSGGVIKDEQGQNLFFVALISDESARLASEEALNKLHSVTSSRHLNFKERVDAILHLGAELFGLPIGIFSKIDGNEYIINQAVHPEDSLEEGMSFDLSGTYCSHVYKANDVQGFNHVSNSEIASHPCFINFGLEAYLGAPIFVDGERYGTLNFSSPKPCRPFIRQDYELVKLFSEWVGHEVARNNDLKALERANQQMKVIANTDVLTGLANRRFTEKTLNELMNHARLLEQPLSVAIIDFDHFKNINDSFGHAVGDQALQLFSEIVNTLGRKSDVYGRWGGEEFLAILPDTDAEGAISILSRVMDKLRISRIEPQDETLKLTVSIGLTTLQNGDSIDQMLHRADNLLYKAKKNGRDQIQND